jgi:PIN domain nuclease of toxin-antitoxin system
VNLLLDTHTLLWFLADDPLLSGAARKLIEQPANRKFVSVATCWEIAIKVGLKKLDLGEPATTFLPRELAVNHFDLLAIELRHATFVETLPPHHKDPFDRLLVAQSIMEAIPLVSVDAAFDAYGVTRLW